MPTATRTTTARKSTAAKPDPAVAVVEASRAVETIEEKVARLRARPLATETVHVPSPAAAAVVAKASADLMAARFHARRALDGLDPADMAAQVEESADVVDARQALEDAQSAAEADSISFTFAQIPPDVYDQFQFEHPPTDAQEERDMAYNPDTMIPAVLEACSTDGLTADMIAGLIRDAVINMGELNVLYAACRKVNETPRLTVGKG